MKNTVYHMSMTPITVVSITTSEECTYIGVAKCGKNERFNAKLGLEIATNRCYKQPFAMLPYKISKKEFSTVVAPLIYNHVCRSLQWQPRLPRIDKKNTKQ